MGRVVTTEKALQIPIKVSKTSWKKVEPVVLWLQEHVNGIHQYFEKVEKKTISLM